MVLVYGQYNKSKREKHSNQAQIEFTNPLSWQNSTLIPIRSTVKKFCGKYYNIRESYSELIYLSCVFVVLFLSIIIIIFFFCCVGDSTMVKFFSLQRHPLLEFCRDSES